MLPDEAIDGETYLTVTQAAMVAGVKPPAIRRWVKIGYLTPAAKDGCGRALYTFAAIIRAEKLARDAAIRTSGTAKRVQRNHEAALQIPLNCSMKGPRDGCHRPGTWSTV